MEKQMSKPARLSKFIDSFCLRLCLVFCVLRACGVIHWAWYWVLTPLVISELLVLCGLMILGVAACKMLTEEEEEKENKGNG